jgi:RNA polymerase sigma factor (sigma-70 family)
MTRSVAVEDHLGLVSKIARRLGPTRWLPLEDLIQEGCFGLMYAARRFRPAAGYRFSTFAAPAIRWSILKALRKTRRAKSLKAWHVKQIAAPPGTDPDVADEVGRLLRCLPREDWQVVEMRFGLGGGGETPVREIAGRLGVSRQWVEFILARSLERMRRQARQPPAVAGGAGRARGGSP